MIPDPFHDTDEASGTVFRDVLTLALLGFLAVIVILLPFVNPKGRKAESMAPPPGNVIVEITWPSEMNADIDLWVHAPGDAPVGYSNKGGIVFNLLRDDLGKFMDPTNINHEVAYTRGLIPGEYTVNVHAYRIDTKNPPPIEVKAVVSVKQESGAADVVPVLGASAMLVRLGQELTIFRFKLDETGRVVEGSVHSLFRPLRSPGAK